MKIGGSMAMGEAFIEVKPGPNFRAALDVLDLAEELFELVPEWHESQRRELVERAKGLREMMGASLNGELEPKAAESQGVCFEIENWSHVDARYRGEKSEKE